MNKMLCGLMMATIWALAAGTAGAAEDWNFEVTPYFFAMGQDGELGVGGLPPADVDVGFSDIWDNLELAGAVFFTARNGPWVGAVDLSFLDLQATETLPSGAKLNSETTAFLGSLYGGYALTEEDAPVALDLLGGMRYQNTDQDLRVSGVGSYSASKNWLDPLVGLNVRVPLGAQWRVNVLADIGGFGVGSDITWQLMPTVNYQFNDTWSAKVGYRWLDVDYEDGGFVYDILTHGFVAGVGIAF